MADLGVSSFDDIISISRAYTSQIGCDAQNAPKYLGALESISKLNLKGGDELEYLLVTERSLNKYTEGTSLVTLPGTANLLEADR
jgi:hypothetical protein